MSGDVLAVFSICRAAAVSATNSCGEQSGVTDDLGIFLYARILASERVCQTLHELPQRLLVWLPRHDGVRFASGCGGVRCLAQSAGVPCARKGDKYIGEDTRGVEQAVKVCEAGSAGAGHG